MEKPWELKPDDGRTKDSLYRFYIFCEDKNTEPAYFKLFQTNKIKIITIPEQKSKCTNINKAIAYCKENNLNAKNKKLPNQEFDIWCVYDKDGDLDPSKNSEIDADFESSYIIARDKGINVAWSNDVFELWFLLHFIDIEVNDRRFTHRNYIYKKLEDILKEFLDKPQSLVKITKDIKFNYSSFMKRTNRVDQIWKPILFSKTEIAIKRAKLLHKSQVSGMPISAQNPCTLVYKLVERLIEKGT